jgi:hypothetical protein
LTALVETHTGELQIIHWPHRVYAPNGLTAEAQVN